MTADDYLEMRMVIEANYRRQLSSLDSAWRVLHRSKNPPKSGYDVPVEDEEPCPALHETVDNRRYGYVSQESVQMVKRMLSGRVGKFTVHEAARDGEFAENTMRHALKALTDSGFLVVVSERHGTCARTYRRNT